MRSPVTGESRACSSDPCHREQHCSAARVRADRADPRKHPALTRFQVKTVLMAVAPWSGRRRLRPEEVRQLPGGVRDSEHRTFGPQGRAGLEWTGIDGIEAESMDRKQHRRDRGAVITRSGDGDSARSTTRTPALLELVIAEVVEAFHHPGRREPLLYDDARARLRCREFLVDAVDLFPVVHRIDEDLAIEQIARNLTEPVHRDCEDEEVRDTNNIIHRHRASARREHVDDQRNAFSRSRSGYGDVVSGGDCRAGDGCAHLAGTDDAQAPVGDLSAGHWIQWTPPQRSARPNPAPLPAPQAAP